MCRKALLPTCVTSRHTMKANVFGQAGRLDPTMLVRAAYLVTFPRPTFLVGVGCGVRPGGRRRGGGFGGVGGVCLGWFVVVVVRVVGAVVGVVC